jgi:glycosyltransferase involved in cell wall biosynthesis
VRLLFLTPEGPAPPDQGARLRTLALIQAAAQHHTVDLLSFHAPERPVDLDALEALCGSVQVIEAPPARSVLGRAWSLLLGIDPLPDLAHRFSSPAFEVALAELLTHRRYDAVQLEGLELMGYHGMIRAANPATRVVYDAHNAETSLQRTMFTTEARDPRRWPAALYSLIQWSKLSSYERIMLNAADLVLAVSEEDAVKLRGRRAEPRVVPNGVDTAAIAYQEPSGSPGRTLLFMGPLDYRPNADAVRWLVARVLPAVRRQVPDVRLRLVGRGSDRIQAAGVEALGYVPDAMGELRRADALVVPMRMGSGVRFKVLEAMASGVPVVSTPLGLAGIAAEPKKHALVGATAVELADATVQVLQDRKLARSVAQAARALVEQQHAWKRVTPIYLRYLRDAVRTRR